MKASTQKTKTLKLTKSRLAWASSPEHTESPWGIRNKNFQSAQPKVEDYQTLCFRLPADTLRIDRILIGGDLLWERSQGSAFNSAVLAGGGRWTFRRTWFARKVVGTDLLIRDLPLARWGNQVPTDIVVVASF